MAQRKAQERRASTIVSKPKQNASLSIIAFDSGYLPELVDLWIASWTEAMPDINFEARRGWLCDHLTSLRQAGANVLCAFDPANGVMAGFVTIDPATCWLDQLVVGATYKGSGAAQQLLDAARSVSPGLIRLDVNAENARARAFYARQGFVETGQGENPVSRRKTVKLEWRGPGTK